MPTEADRETYIGLEHLDSGNLTVTRWGSDVDIKGQKLVMHKGDILFGRRNTYLKRAAIAPHDGLFSAHGMIWRTKEDVVDASFFPFFVSSDYFMDEAIRISVGSLSPTINWRDLKELEFDLPDIDTQRKLSTLLWAMERAKTAYKNLIAKTDELVKSQFVEMFGENKAGCRYLKLEDCCTKITGGKTPSMSHPEFYGGDIPFIKSGDVKESTVSKGVLWLTEEAITNGGASLLPKDSIIVVIRSAALRHEFHVAVTEVPVVINQDLKAFQPKPEFMPIYLQWAIMSHESSLLGKVQTVLTSHIEMSDLLSIPVMVADLEQQQAFCDFKQQADKSKFAAQQALADLTATQKALMRQYLG